jgi:tetratricopeptide (TPR) repeat protein
VGHRISGNARLASCRCLALLGLGLAPFAAAQATPQPEVASLLAQADALYARRAEGAQGAVADPLRIAEAVALYRRAQALAPQDAEALFKLLRALHFQGAFCGADVEARRAIFEEGRRLGQPFVDRLEKAAESRTPAERLAMLRKVPHAAEAYFWTAAHWGQWALLRSRLALARQGVAGKLRDLAQTVIDLDPALEEGGGHRLLGRLHDQSPKLPFFTGWVSKEKALAHLRQSYRIAPQNAVTRFFLAEAILEHEPLNQDEARRLLRSCVDDPPKAEYLVEDRFYAEQARERLSGLKQR